MKFGDFRRNFGQLAMPAFMAGFVALGAEESSAWRMAMVLIFYIFCIGKFQDFVPKMFCPMHRSFPPCSFSASARSSGCAAMIGTISQPH